MASGAADTNIGIWSPYNYSLLYKIINAHSNAIYYIKWIKSGYLASAGADWDINIWNINTFSYVRTLSGHNGCVNWLVILSNGNLASGSDDGDVRVWNVNTGQTLTTYSTPLNYVYTIYQLKNGDLAMVGAYKSVYFLNMTASTTKSISIASSGSTKLNGIVIFNKDGTLVTAYDNNIALVNATSYAKIKTYTASAYSGDTVFCLEYYQIGNMN